MNEELLNENDYFTSEDQIELQEFEEELEEQKKEIMKKFEEFQMELRGESL